MGRQPGEFLIGGQEESEKNILSPGPLVFCIESVLKYFFIPRFLDIKLFIPPC